MTDSATTSDSVTTKTIFIKMAISAWDSHNARVNKLINSLSDEDLAAETASGRNSGIYLFGHLIAVSDGLFPLLGFGEKLYPELEDIFLKNPDKSGHAIPAISQLKEYWNKVNTKLSNDISHVSADEWFARHNSVSADDFAKEPHRNKLNIIINRTNHTSYHLGQLVYLVKK
ncbi:MAG: DinB family protein [Bacteroidota bacterium]